MDSVSNLFSGTPTTPAVQALIAEGIAFQNVKKVISAFNKFKEAYAQLKKSDFTTEKQLLQINVKITECLSLNEANFPTLKPYLYEALRLSRKLNGVNHPESFSLTVRFIDVCGFLEDYVELFKQLSQLVEISTDPEEKKMATSSLEVVTACWQKELKELGPLTLLSEEKMEQERRKIQKFLEEARQFLEKNKLDSAKSHFNLALRSSKQLHANDLLVAECLISFASRSKVLAKVHALFKEAEPICQFHGDTKLLYRGWIDAGNSIRKESKKDAVEVYREAEKYTEDKSEVINILNKLYKK